MKRTIIRIDEERCNGCGLCIPNCPEGALRVIDGKARIIGDILCDGIGACIGFCPESAITIETREAEPYDERKVMETMLKQGPEVLIAHLNHLRNHRDLGYLSEALAYLSERGVPIPSELVDSPREAGAPPRNAPSNGCPVLDIGDLVGGQAGADSEDSAGNRSRLGHWPVQLALVPPSAPFFAGADVLIAADCVPFAFADFHERLLRGKVCLVGCPKLDSAGQYIERLAAAFEANDIRSVTIAHMEVPCCSGWVKLVEAAIARSGKRIPVEIRIVSVKGEPIRWS